MTLSRSDCLHWMGIETWQRKPAPMPPAPANPWDILQQEVSTCTACALHCSRTRTVFERGNRHARVMVIGEAPGFYEDREGKPFVGRAGKLLDAMLKSIGLDEENVYIANILKCRPPNNRDPQPEEVSQCTPFLIRQIRLVQPDLLLAVGRISAHFLLKTTSPLNQLRQKPHTHTETGIPLLVTYHPAYLLRNPADKRKAFLDLQLVALRLSKT